MESVEKSYALSDLICRQAEAGLPQFVQFALTSREPSKRCLTALPLTQVYPVERRESFLLADGLVRNAEMDGARAGLDRGAGGNHRVNEYGVDCYTSDSAWNGCARWSARNTPSGSGCTVSERILIDNQVLNGTLSRLVGYEPLLVECR